MIKLNLYKNRHSNKLFAVQWFNKINKNVSKNINIQITHKQPCPFTPSHIYPMTQQKKGTQAMYNILDKYKEISTGQVTWNKLYNITKNEMKYIYI